MTITLEEIEIHHAKTGQMIDALKAQAKFEGQFPITVPAPQLLPGERFVCSIIEPNGTSYHLTFLPDDRDGTDQDSMLGWAESIGGDLPDTAEQRLLLKFMPEEFQECAYWSKERYKHDSAAGLCTYFDGGGTNWRDRSGELRGRAVRRLVFQ